MNHNKTLAYLGAAVSALLLSACAGNYKLTSDSGPNNSALQVGLSDGGSSNSGSGGNNGGGAVVTPPSDGNTVTGNSPGGSDGGNNGGCPTAAACPNPNPSPTPPSTGEQGPETEICVLGPDGGNKLKLGLDSNGKLEAQNTSVSGALCMSANACLNIVSKKFDVKGLFPGNPCGNNPNTTPISDADVQALIDAI